MSDLLFVNAAIQNRGYDLDENPGKINGILVAQLLNRMHGVDETVHLWNTVGAFHQSEEQDAKQRLTQKYASNTMKDHLEFWKLDLPHLDVIDDTDSDFAAWSLDRLEEYLTDGKIYIEEAKFSYCSSCGIAIAEDVVNVDSCGTCGNAALEIIREYGLFLDVPDDRSSLLSDKVIFNHMNIRAERGMLEQIPPRLLLSRDREIGVDLSQFGLTGKKLDPRLGVGLLALFIADRRGYESIGMTQTASTLIRTAPYIGSLALEGRLLFVPYSKIKDDVFSSEDPFLKQVVSPFASAQRRQDVTYARLEIVGKEFEKTQRNAIALQQTLGKLGVSQCVEQTRIDLLAPAQGSLHDFTAKLGKTSGRLLEQVKRQEDSSNIPSETLNDIQAMINFVERFNGS